MSCRTGIYLIIRTETGVPYVGLTGKSFERRWAEHRKRLNANSAGQYVKLQRAWNKYGESAFEFVVHTEIPQEDMPDDKFYTRLRLEEARVLALYPDNLNSTLAGEHGMRLADETRAKMSEWRRGRRLPAEIRAKVSAGVKRRYDQDPECREKISAAGKRRKISAEHRASILKAIQGNQFTKGRKLSPEHRERLRQANLGNKHTLGMKQSPETSAKKSASLRAYHAARRAKLERQDQ